MAIADIPRQIPEGARIIALKLKNGDIAVKVNEKDECGRQLYAIHSKDYVFKDQCYPIEAIAALKSASSDTTINGEITIVKRQK